MYGRKFLQLKHKITKYSSSEESNKGSIDTLNEIVAKQSLSNEYQVLPSQNNKFNKLNRSEENSKRSNENLKEIVANLPLSNGKMILSQNRDSFSFRDSENIFQIDPEKNSKSEKTTTIKNNVISPVNPSLSSNLKCELNNVLRVFDIFMYDKPKIYEYINQSISKYKLSVLNTSIQHEKLCNESYFYNENKLEDYLNNKQSVFYSDRFYIYPSTQINKKYYNKRNRNSTKKVCLTKFWNQMTNKKKYFNLQIIILYRFEYTSDDIAFIKKLNILEKNYLEKIAQLKEYEIELEKLKNREAIYETERTKILKTINFGELHRKNLNEYIHSIKGNIRVYCRVKPTTENSIIKYPELGLNLNVNEIMNLEIKNLKTNEISNFNFDKIFTENSTQEEIFFEVLPFIQSAIDGENVCIFAYGSTGSGKTFTMQGNFTMSGINTSIINESSGILPRCAEFIFEETSRINLLGQKIKIYFSAIEIYNENLYDLLENKSRKAAIKQPLSVFIANSDIQIKNLNWIVINSKEDIIKYTKEASDSRRSDSTHFNTSSSRSHAIFQIKLENQRDNNTFVSSIINIIDLAGSERSSIQSLSGKTKEELDIIKKIQNEANFINKSLTTLGRIISLIGDKKSCKLAIPYRESKLTMVLQNSLKSNSKTVMIVTICSDFSNYNLSKESLKFATNAMLSC